MSAVNFVWIFFIGVALTLLPRGAAAAGKSTTGTVPLDAELTQILAALPGRYTGQASDSSRPEVKFEVVHHIARVDAPQFGSGAVFYHEVSRAESESATVLLRDVYVFDLAAKRSANSMRVIALPAAPQTLDLKQVTSLPSGCLMDWSRDQAPKAFVAQARREDCAAGYVLTNASLTVGEIRRGADRKSAVGASTFLAAKRTTPEPPPPGTSASVLAASGPVDWRRLDPERTLYMELRAGRVVIELAPDFAPLHVQNIKALIRERFFDGLGIDRVQDNFVTQWGDPDGSRVITHAARTIAPEFTQTWTKDLPFTKLADADGFAPVVGFSNGFAVAGDPRSKRIWMAHCYGVLGVGRDNAEDSGSGVELYAVIGQAPRQLDRNIAVVGRVVQGMELLASLPRGTGPLGFYETPAQRTPIRSIRLAAEVPEAERTRLELLRTDSATFLALIEARRNRRDDWYKVPAGFIDLCNVPLPARRYDATTH